MKILLVFLVMLLHLLVSYSIVISICFGDHFTVKYKSAAILIVGFAFRFSICFS